MAVGFRLWLRPRPDVFVRAWFVHAGIIRCPLLNSFWPVRIRGVLFFASSGSPPLFVIHCLQLPRLLYRTLAFNYLCFEFGKPHVTCLFWFSFLVDSIVTFKFRDPAVFRLACLSRGRSVARPPFDSGLLYWGPIFQPISAPRDCSGHLFFEQEAIKKKQENGKSCNS